MARLNLRGISNSELEARWLLKYSRLEDLDTNILRRLNHEPLAKILGTKGFYKYEFLTNKDTLDPRPESELLVEEALLVFHDRQADINILDICSGTGCLGLSVLSEYESGKLALLDVSKKAMEVAKKNSESLNLLKRTEFVIKNMKDFVSEKPFDLILFNPPYLRREELPLLDKETKFDPMLALDGGIDGLDFYKAFKPEWLNGVLILEIGQNQENEVKNIMLKKGLKLVKMKKDIQNINRMMVFSNSL